jgi:DNA-binding transcriptional MerR regulator
MTVQKNKNNSVTYESVESCLKRIPEKFYYSIGEVAKHLEIKPHVLRYWEKNFEQLEPIKRRGRRYYSRDHIELILQIKKLMHQDRFTLNGATRCIDSMTNSRASVEKKPVSPTIALIISDLELIAQDLVFDEHQLEAVS